MRDRYHGVANTSLVCEYRLTTSAGIAPNKFLTKIASDWNKPNGQFVIKPAAAFDFLTPLPVGRLPGVGKVMEAKLAKLKVEAQINGEKLRVTAKKRDDLQEVMTLLKKSDIELPLQFENFRD